MFCDNEMFCDNRSDKVHRPSTGESESEGSNDAGVWHGGMRFKKMLKLNFFSMHLLQIYTRNTIALSFMGYQKHP